VLRRPPRSSVSPLRAVGKEGRSPPVLAIEIDPVIPLPQAFLWTM
jgi:hypothetical protein